MGDNMDPITSTAATIGDNIVPVATSIPATSWITTLTANSTWNFIATLLQYVPTAAAPFLYYIAACKEKQLVEHLTGLLNAALDRIADRICAYFDYKFNASEALQAQLNHANTTIARLRSENEFLRRNATVAGDETLAGDETVAGNETVAGSSGS